MRGRFRNRSFCIEHTLFRHSPLRVFLFLPNQNHHNQNWIPRHHHLCLPTHLGHQGRHLNYRLRHHHLCHIAHLGHQGRRRGRFLLHRRHHQDTLVSLRRCHRYSDTRLRCLQIHHHLCHIAHLGHQGMHHLHHQLHHYRCLLLVLLEQLKLQTKSSMPQGIAV